MARRIPNHELFDAIWSWAWDERLCPAGSISVQPLDFTESQQPAPEHELVAETETAEAPSFSEPDLPEKKTR